MKLFFITADSDSTDSELFCAAETPIAAYKLWAAWYADADKPKSVIVYTLPQPIAQVAYDWSALEQTMVRVS